MSKDKLTDYSATNSLNTDVGGVNIDEGMLPSDVNNALREVMTHLKDFAEGTQAVNNIRFAGATTTGDINFGDNDKAVFGAGSDLQIYHDGTSNIFAGNIVIDGSDASTSIGSPAALDIRAGDANYEYATLRLATSANGSLGMIGAKATTTGAYPSSVGQLEFAVQNGALTNTILTANATGIDVTGNATFDDNGKAIFGAGSDLQIYHDGSNSWLRDTGTGNLYIQGSSAVYIRGENSEFLASFGENSATTLYHNGNSKLATSATGADINGVLTADGLTVDGDATISSGTPTLQLTDTGGTNQFATLKQDGSNLKILSRNNTVSGGILMRRNVGGTETDAIQLSANGDISFYDSTGVTQGFFWDASTQRLGLGTTSPATKLDIDAGNVLSFGDASYGVVGGVTYPGIVGGAGNILFANKNYGNAAVGLGFYNSGTYEPVVTVRTSGNVGIGTASPSAPLHTIGVNGLPATSGTTQNNALRIGAPSTNVVLDASSNGGVGTWLQSTNQTDLSLNYPLLLNPNGGNVGIGTAAPSRAIHVVSSGLNIATFEASNGDSIDLGYDSLSASRTGDFFIDNRDASGNNIQYRCGSSASHIFNIGTSEVVRIDSNERFLVGKTAYGSVSTDGTAIDPSFFQTSASNDRPMLVNRNGTDGNHIEFFKAGSPTGSIGTNSSRTYIGSGSGQSGIKFNTNAIVPAAGADGANSDNTYDLGISSARFKNLYLNNVAYLQNIRGVNDTDSGIDVNGTNIVTFRTGGSERARVTSTGQLLVGQTTNQAHLNTATGDGLTITQSGEINQGTTGESMILNRRGSDGIITRFRREGNSVGSINVTASGTTYNTTSDLRLKENIEPLVATDKLMAMNPVSYNWKADPDGPRSMGFIAQEMQEVMPEAVAVGDDEDAMMSMDYGRITPILVSALQDAHRKIEELEQRIADMEAK